MGITIAGTVRTSPMLPVQVRDWGTVGDKPSPRRQRKTEKEGKEPVCPGQREGALGRGWGLLFPARMDNPTELGLQGATLEMKKRRNVGGAF